MSHQKPDEDAECMVCFGPLSEEYYCEYKIHEDDDWTPSPLCMECIDMMRNDQWGRFSELIDKADCKASLLRLCNRIPLCVHDSHAFVCAQHGTDCPKQGELHSIWSAHTKQEEIPILVGAKQGAEREKYIEHLRHFAEFLENSETKTDKTSEEN